MPTSTAETEPLLRSAALREPLALLRWHDGRCRASLQNARQWVSNASDADLLAWLGDDHRVLVQCAGGRRCPLEASDGAVRLVGHPAYGEEERIAEVLAPRAEVPACRFVADVLTFRQPRRLWLWDDADRRERQGSVDPHLASLAIGWLALAWRAEPETPQRACYFIRQGMTPAVARQRRTATVGYPPGAAPTERPPYRGLGYPCGPWLNRIADQVAESGRRRRACAVCWRYGVHTLGADLCAPCFQLLPPVPANADRATQRCADYSTRLMHGPAECS